MPRLDKKWIPWLGGSKSTKYWIQSQIDTKMVSIRCPADYYPNPTLTSKFSALYKFARLYQKSRLFWLMTFFFLLPLIYTVLGAVVIAIKSAHYRQNSASQIKARDERRMNALIVAVLVGFLLCWIPHYSYEVKNRIQF